MARSYPIIGRSWTFNTDAGAVCVTHEVVLQIVRASAVADGTALAMTWRRVRGRVDSARAMTYAAIAAGQLRRSAAEQRGEVARG